MQNTHFANEDFKQDMESFKASGRKPLHGNLIKKYGTSSPVSLSSRSASTVQIIARSEYNIAENYGLPLPVLVNEALTFSEKNVPVSINCSSNGWAWAVYGRRLFVWQYKESRCANIADSAKGSHRRTTTAQCRELTLPHCDIGHKASLITVFITDGQHMASCLAVSPTGDLRFWPSISHDGSSIDSAGVLEGQEFDYILSCIPQSYILVTTTCSIVLLQLQFQSGRHRVNYKALRPPSGFFGGIGRKFASIIIGVNNNQDKENKLIRITGEKYRHSDCLVTLLADRWVQRWIITQNEGEQFLFEDSDIIRKIRDAILQKVPSNKDKEIEIKLLDMQASDSTVFLLTGILNILHAAHIHYVIVTMSQDNCMLNVLNVYPLKLSLFYGAAGSEDNSLQMKFLLNRGFVYLYNDNTVYIANIASHSSSEDDVEKIEFQHQGDKIISASTCLQIPLFFTRKHGFICIGPAEGNFDSSDFLNSTFAADSFGTSTLSEAMNNSLLYPNASSIGNIGMYFLDPEEMCDINNDAITQMKAAFIYHIKGNNNKCSAVLRELLELDEVYHLEVQLDKIIVNIAKDLADDIPFADPRWERQEFNQKLALGSSASLQILQQLKEKKLAMKHFVDFLRLKGLWEKLNVVTENGLLKSTYQVLFDISEKIVATAALKFAQNQANFKNIIEDAIRIVIEERNQFPTSNLTYQDLFYVKTTKVEEIFAAFLIVCKKYVEIDYQPSKLVTLLCDINAIVSLVLNEIINFRINNANLSKLVSVQIEASGILPWTATPEKQGLCDVFLSLIDTTLKHGARVASEPELKQKLYEQIVGLIDFVLDGKKTYLENIMDNEKYGISLQQYELQKRELISPLVQDQQFELAAKLAEKYHDFLTLVLICDQTHNQARLEKYIQTFKEYDFAKFAVNWHLKQNKQVDLFLRFKNYKEDLTKFLGDHPSLLWLQFISNNKFESAAKVLADLAKNEVALVTKKKTMLSLAKLCALANGDEKNVDVNDVDADLLLVDFQEQLPDNIFHPKEYDIENPRVLTVEEIINILISDRMGTEIDFRKAIELLNYVKDPFEMKRKIWCSAILKDSWTDYNMNSPVEKLNELLFFKLIELCYLSDGEAEHYLLDMETLLNSPELRDLSTKTSFQYLLKLCYEHVFELYSKK